MKELKLKPIKSAAQIKAENRRKAKALPVETRIEFWRLMMSGSTLGDAREAFGIDLMVAGELVLLCHETLHIPLDPDKIE